MTTFDQLDEALAAHGWRYDSANQRFLEGDEPLDWEDLVGVVPRMTPDELAAYQDAKFDELCRKETI